MKAANGYGLVLQGVTISLSHQTLIDNLNLAIAPGKVATVMGPSGSGKSSLLAFVAGFLDRTSFSASGTIELGGRDVTALPPEKRRIGLLFQDDLLFPHLTVAGNLLFGVPATTVGRSAREELVNQALAEAGLSGFAERDPATLSGGQKARVALMRVLLSQPRALLLDEAFAKLDTTLRGAFRAMVIASARERGLPVLMVTHDPDDAAAAGGELVRL